MALVRPAILLLGKVQHKLDGPLVYRESLAVLCSESGSQAVSLVGDPFPLFPVLCMTEDGFQVLEETLNVSTCDRVLLNFAFV